MGLLLNKFSEYKKNRANNLEIEEISIDFDGEIKPFEFEGERYYVAIRDDILVFDKNMELIYTLTKEQIFNSSLPLIKRVGEIITETDATPVKLFVKRNGSFEKLSFYNNFDATFIMKKMKRVAARPDENIEEIFIENDGAIIEHYKANGWQRKFPRGVFHYHKKESDTVFRFVDVEDTLEALISELVNGTAKEIDIDKIDECIEMLQKLKDCKL